jgi:hypothetical protein
VAEACVLDAEGDAGERDAAFGRARAILRRYRLLADEADLLHAWGQALGRAGDGPGAAEKLDEALDVMRRHEAGAAWIDRVSADHAALAR